MADLPIQNDEKKEVPLTLEERVKILESDVRELSRGANAQASLLEGIVVSFDKVVQRYLSITRTEPNEKPPEA